MTPPTDPSDSMNRLGQPVSAPRPRVPPRTDSLQDSSSVGIGGHPTPAPTPQPQIDDSPLLVTKQITLRLEVGLLDDLQNLAKAHNVSREALVSALFRHMERQHLVEMPQVIEAATEIHNLRMKEGERKRLVAQLKNFREG